MSDWRSILKYDPIKPLASSGDMAIEFFTAKDLLGGPGRKVEMLWNLPPAQNIINKQQPDGSWKYPGGNQKIRAQEDYNQIETYRNLGYLVQMYGFNKSHPAIKKAADFLFSCQTKAGDIRGILGNQYTPYYTGGMLELLIKAGYADDSHVEKAFDWLNGIRQDDGGWAIPLRTHGKKLDIIAMDSNTLEPDRAKPSSHLVTGVVLRAYAAHPDYRGSDIARAAGLLMLSSLFKKDHYPDRGSPDYWLRFTYPFWFTDLISALDSLTKLGFKNDEPQIQKATDWFAGRQQKNGLWKLKTLKNQKKYKTDLWISLAICRNFKYLYR